MESDHSEGHDSYELESDTSFSLLHSELEDEDDYRVLRHKGERSTENSYFQPLIEDEQIEQVMCFDGSNAANNTNNSLTSVSSQPVQSSSGIVCSSPSSSPEDPQHLCVRSRKFSTPCSDQKRKRTNGNLVIPVKNDRRTAKQLTERKRRDRINSLLDSLRGLILKLLHKNPRHHRKLEKADILELVVAFLKRELHKSKKRSALDASGMNSKPNELTTDNAVVVGQTAQDAARFPMYAAPPTGGEFISTQMGFPYKNYPNIFAFSPPAYVDANCQFIGNNQSVYHMNTAVNSTKTSNEDMLPMSTNSYTMRRPLGSLANGERRIMTTPTVNPFYNRSDRIGVFGEPVYAQPSMMNNQRVANLTDFHSCSLMDLMANSGNENSDPRLTYSAPCMKPQVALWRPYA